MLEFWRAIFYSQALDPIFAAVAGAMNVSKQVCKEYCTSGVMLYGPTMAVIVVAVIAVLFLVKLFGWLNAGNLPKYNPDKMDKVPGSPLQGKHLIFLGSSVTKGFAAYGKSFADMIAARTGAVCVKEAVSGTTLADNGAKSYVSRLKAMDKNTPCDVFVCQLSTNDATKKVPLGAVAAGKDPAGFDTATVCGAIEYIIAYAQQTWHCPVVFYTNPQYASPAYKAIVDVLPEIAEKWGVQVIDLWHDAAANAKEAKKHSCMNDQIHPTKRGYQVWTPIFEAALANVLAGKPVPARPAISPAVTDADVAKQKSGRTAHKAVCWILAAVLAILVVVGGSTVQQLVSVKGLQNEGNSEQYNPENQTANPDSPIQGKKLLWLGSSVFQGFGAGNTSPAEWFDAIDGTDSIVEVMGGTFLATVDGEVGGGAGGDISADSSYINRLRNNYNAENTPALDLVVVQLSTNDSKGQCEIGEVSDATEQGAFDESTTIGSLEAIITYTRDTWDVPVFVISGTQFQDEMTYSGGQSAELYLDMIDKCHQLEEKWGDQFYFLDLWHNEAMYLDVETGGDLWRSYMSDAIHPTRKGYLQWWGPYIEDRLYEILA